MFRKPTRRENKHTEPDHRPMIPVFRGPDDPIDAAIQERRSRCELANPKDYTNWR